MEQASVLVLERLTSQAASHPSGATYGVTVPCLSAVPLLIASAMRRSLLLVLVVLVLLSYVPPGKMESPPCGIINNEGKEDVRF